MRILLDQNLSPKLVQKLAGIFPGLETVYDHELVGGSDPFISIGPGRQRSQQSSAPIGTLWILAERLDPPPKVIRIERCEFPAKTIKQLLRWEGRNRVETSNPRPAPALRSA